MLDPNTVADCSAHIPPAYHDYPKEGSYVLPSYPKKAMARKQKYTRPLSHWLDNHIMS